MEKVPENRNDFRNDFFFSKTEISETLFGSLWIVTEFRNIPEVSETFRKIVPEISGFRTIGTIITLKSYICKYNTS